MLCHPMPEDIKAGLAGETPPDPAATGGEPTGTEETPNQESYSKAEVADLLKALRSEREARKQHEKNLRDAAAQLEQLKGIDPEQYAKLQAESAKRAELEAELAGKVQGIERTYSEQLAKAKEDQEKAAREVADLNLRWAFEKAFQLAGGRGGEFTSTAFDKLKDKIKHEPDGSIAIVGKDGGYVLEDGKRVDPVAWLKKFKSDSSILGYCFENERGHGTGFTPAPGTALASGVDMHSLSTNDLFLEAFARKDG